MAEHLSQSELDYPFKLLEYLNGFRISKVCGSCCISLIHFLFYKYRNHLKHH